MKIKFKTFLILLIFIIYRPFYSIAQTNTDYSIVKINITNNSWCFEEDELCPKIMILINDSLIFNEYVLLYDNVIYKDFTPGDITITTQLGENKNTKVTASLNTKYGNEYHLQIKFKNKNKPGKLDLISLNKTEELLAEKNPDKGPETGTNNENEIKDKSSETEKPLKEKDKKTQKDSWKGFSYGLAIGSSEMAGMPFRYYTNQKLAFELGTYYRSILITGSFPQNVRGSLMFSGGTNVYLFEHSNAGKEKVKQFGLSLKGNYSLSKIGNEQSVTFGLAYENIHKRNNKYSFIFEIGGELINQDFNYPYENEVYDSPVLFYWKCHWNWLSK